MVDTCSCTSPSGITRYPERHLSLLALMAICVASIALGNASRLARAQDPTASPEQTQAGTETDDRIDATELIEALSKRCAFWLAPACPRLEQLTYTFLLGQAERPVKLVKGTSNVRYSLWQGCSLRTGIHALLRQPNRFTVDVMAGDDDQTIRIRAQRKPSEKPVGIEVGNGIERSWSGYYSHSTREVVLVVERNRLLPLEEKSGQTTVRYQKWMEVGNDRWVPGMIDILKGKTHYRMHFQWMGNAAWLLTRGESISRDGITVRARTRNVKVNGTPVARQLTEEERRGHDAGKVVQQMLDRNRAWLDPGLAAFDSIEYTFHTVREDVREQGYLNRDGVAVIEVTHDGQEKMGDRLGDRRMALPTEETAYADREARFAKISPRAHDRKNAPADERFRHYTRIGCQLDLPIFRYRERLDTAQVTVEEGAWNGRPCHVVRISNLGNDIYLGAGTMFGFTSWSYVHHVRPSFELVYIDKETFRPLHETLSDARSGRIFEIDFSDYVSVNPGNDAPLSITVTAAEYFTANYRFQLVKGRHWMLKEISSWFDAENISRGMVEDVRVNQASKLLAAAMAQIEASRRMFGETTVEKKLAVGAMPINFGKGTDIGSYRVLLTVAGPWDVVAQVETQDESAPAVVPLLLLDAEDRPLLAAHVKLEPSDNGRRGTANLGSSRAIGDVRRCIVPGAVGTGNGDHTVPVLDCRWDQPLEINVRDANAGETSAFEIRLTYDANHLARAKVSLASQAGPAEFLLDVSVALLADDGQPVAAGQHHGTMRVERGVVEAVHDVDLGQVSDPSRATHLVVAVTPGNVISAPMGSVWGRFVRERHPISVEQLLAADDEPCWDVGLRQVGSQFDLERELFEGLRDRARISERGQDRKSVLGPYVTNLVQIIGRAQQPEVLSQTVRLLGHAGAREHAGVIRPLLDHGDDGVVDDAAAALAMLGGADGLQRLRAVLQREWPDGENSREARRTASRLEVDTLIGLAALSDQPSIDVLGETLSRDLEALSITEDGEGRPQLSGRPDRIRRTIAVLGHAGNEEAVVWLKSAARFFAEHPDISEHVDQIPLAEALVQYEELTRDFIAAQIEKGHFAYIRSFKLDGHYNDYYVPAVRKMLLDPAVSAWTAHQAVTYLWNVGTLAAVEVLQDAHSQGVQKEDARTWMLICEALAALGDDRGVDDAFEALVELWETTEPPADEDMREAWEDRREWLEEGAEDILSRVSRPAIMRLVLSRLTSDRGAERRAVAELLWQLPETPEPVRVILQRWRGECAEDDPDLSRQLFSLLSRDAE